MSNTPPLPPAITADHLAVYVTSTAGLQGKMSKIISNQLDSANSLGRAAAHLREIARLSPPGNRNPRLNNETAEAKA